MNPPTASLERIKLLVPESEREDFAREILERYLGIAVLSGVVFFCVGFFAAIVLVGVIL